MKKKDEIKAFLGKNTEFDGKLSFTGTIRVDGRFEGEILGDGTLIVGDSAAVKADVRVSNLIVSGEIRGSLFASERIEVRPPGKVFGNIQSPIVVMEEGVVFDGQCHMVEPSEPEGENEAVPT
jgi:cytoskeletal protein CcmA (bactofilin family)